MSSRMSTRISPLAGQPVPTSLLSDVDKLVAAYFSERPDPSVPTQRVAFGTSGHRGSAFLRRDGRARTRASRSSAQGCFLHLAVRATLMSPEGAPTQAGQPIDDIREVFDDVDAMIYGLVRLEEPPL
jgi:hypothetical protein